MLLIGRDDEFDIVVYACNVVEDEGGVEYVIRGWRGLISSAQFLCIADYDLRGRWRINSSSLEKGVDRIISAPYLHSPLETPGAPTEIEESDSASPKMQACGEFGLLGAAETTLSEIPVRRPDVESETPRSRLEYPLDV